MSTTQQETRARRIMDLAEWLEQFGHYENLELATFILDGPVARMIADAEQAAERRGAERLVGIVQSMATDFRALADPDGHRALRDVLALAEREGLL